jgi:hypothetical protein
VPGPERILAQAASERPESLVLLIAILAVIVLVIAGLWRVFSKAGEPGWTSLVPFWNILVMLRIAGRPQWWILLLFLPIISLIISALMAIDLGKSFGKGTAFGLGLAFLPFIFYPILGFDDSEYLGPAGS